MSNDKLKYINKGGSEKLQTNDLIKLGLYTILLILSMGLGVGLSSFLVTLIFGGKVYFAVYTTVATGFFAAPAFTLIFNKIRKKNAILIVSVITGLFLLLSGHAAIGFPVAVVCGVVAEYFARKNSEYISYIFYTLGSIGVIIPMFFMKNNYIEHLKAKDFTQEKIDFVMSNSSLPTFFYVIIFTVISSFIGIYIGRKIYFRNFDKAGL